ncbi:MAG TPA: FemAB family XrtA/PEP-CTERM system-associated protein [Gemmatimonadaceae bacterium]|nr:FemAB family XrtA/PEP-CTERM system-associated protein [Gemmatimonadaceae bacterium]
MTERVGLFSGDSAEWDAFARSRRGFTHFHLHGWQSVMERVFGHECIYLGARDHANRLTGILPLVRVRSLVFGHFLVSMPFVNYGGPLGDDEAVVALVHRAAELARATGVGLLELRSPQVLPLGLDASHRKITVLLDLPASAGALLKSFDAKVRSQVRRPQKEGVEVRFGADQVDPFFEVFSRHMRDLGTPAQPRRLFATIAETFGEEAWFGCAYLNGRAIAGGCGFRWGGEFEMTWASSLRAYNRIAANMLLYWSFMERAIAEGVAVFNFGRCSPGSGTHRFKQQWGGRDVPLWWYHPVQSGMTATPSPSDSTYAWGPKLWRRLPASFTSTLGPRIVRYIP